MRTSFPRGFTNHRFAILFGAAVIGMTSIATIGMASEEIPKIEASVNAPANVNAAPPSDASAPPPTEENVVPPDEEPEDKPVDPQECRDVQRQLRDQARELKRIEPKLVKAKLTTEVEGLKQLRGKVNAWAAQFKKGCMRDQLQEFYDAEVWEMMNEFRAKAELPQQHTQIERELKRLEKRLTAKFVGQTGLDGEQLKARLAEIRSALDESKRELSAGNFQDANDAMQPIWDGMHPGEVNGVVDRLREITTNMKRVRDAEIKAQLQELIQPIIDAANEGDFREANQALNEIHSDLMRVLSQVTRSAKYRGDFGAKLDQLEEKINAKIEGGNASATKEAPAQ